MAPTPDAVTTVRRHRRPDHLGADHASGCSTHRGRRGSSWSRPAPELIRRCSASGRRRRVPVAATTRCAAALPGVRRAGACRCDDGRGVRHRRLLPRRGRRPARRAAAGPHPARRRRGAHQRPGPRADNAAVALRLLGQRDRLVWYVPVARRPRRRRRRHPRHPAAPLARPALWLLAVAGVGLLAVAGPPARPAGTEPLPVDGQGHRDHPQPRPALPQGRRPRPRGRGPARGRPRPGWPSGCACRPRPTSGARCATSPRAPAAPSTRSTPCSAPMRARPRHTTTT